jgi:Uroporphyrinogen decarboxylase (URO-D)
MADARFASFMGLGPARIAHWEHWSCPDAETVLTGIDYYEHPRLCRQRLCELYPQLGLSIPANDNTIPRPRLGSAGFSADHQRHTVRWGAGETGTFQHGEAFFRSPEEVFAFSPLEHADFRAWPHVVMNWDFSSEEAVYQRLRRDYPPEWGDHAPDGVAVEVGFYNTTFMWPLLTFGWELFLECCLDPRFEVVMGEFAELNRRVFRAFARLPVHFAICHDDIFTSRGPVCSPHWMHRYVFPRYEEFWSILRAAGKEVIFMADGCADAYVDDVMACGARGIVSEPFTDYKAVARRYRDCFIAGEGDNRILMQNDPQRIRAMVEQMAETGRMSGGYMMCVGNHIPWNVPPAAIKLYLDLADELAWR